MTAPDWVYQLPTLNACLNGLAGLLLVVGMLAIKRGRRKGHERLMYAAFATSVVFLASYLTYHFTLLYYTGESSQKFQGEGLVRPIYYTILITHVILAAAVPFLAIKTIRRGQKAQWESHRRIAKITLPIWLYVSATGVIIYLMLYHWPVA